MPEPRIKSSTGNAPLKKQGHTASSAHGSDPDMKRRYPNGTRDLKVK